MENWIKNFAGIPLGQRLILLVTLAATVATLLVTVLWAQRPDYEPLFAGLAMEDANAIVSQLRDQKVAYQLGAGGSTVLVPSTQVHELRMKMAQEGLPSGNGVGFEIFDNSSYGTTDYVQRINYRRALEGELARTIGAMDQVRSARVHLVIPEKRLFSKDQEAARASVTLKLSSRASMGEESVSGILHLVASAVEGLAPERVTVVDYAGRVLYAGGDKSGSGKTVGTNASYRAKLEQRLRERVMDILSPAVGRDRVQVQVAATLDFTQRETTQELFDPNVSVVRSEQRTKEQSSGRSGIAAGVAGVTAEAGGDSNRSKSQNETINYELNKTVSHTISQLGEIKRLSVAVLVDGELFKGEGAAAPDETLAKYAALVKKAIGFDEARGDSVEVVSIPFASVEVFEAPADPGMMEKLTPYAGPALRYVMALIAIGMVIAMVLKPLVKVISSPVKIPVHDLVLADGIPKTVAELESENSQLFEDFEPDMELPSTRADVLRMAQDNPRQAAEMLKNWMKEG